MFYCLPLLTLFLFYVAMVTGGGLNVILSAGVWDFLFNSEVLSRYQNYDFNTIPP